MWLLSIEDYEGLTTFHRLAGDRYTLGRAPDNDFVLAQLNVSRRQGRLERRGDDWVYIDEGSSLGSYVNCGLVRAYEPVPLQDGAVVQFSDYVLRLSKAELEGAPTPPPRYVEPARLRALSGPLAGAEHVFGRSELVTIGRADECTLSIVHEQVSEIHAVIRPLGDGRHELVDKSHNGLLFVNGQRLEWSEHALEGGDAINVGGVALFRYLEASQQPDPRFDEHWGAPETTPEIKPSAPEARISRDVEDGALPENRVEVVGPVPLPAPRPPSASFQRLCRATIGHGVRGPVVVKREPIEGVTPRRTDVSTWYAGVPASMASPQGSGSTEPRAVAVAPERYPSGLTLSALAAPVGVSGVGASTAPTPKLDAWPDEAEAPEAERAVAPPNTPPHSSRLRSAFFWAAVVALGAVGGSKLATLSLKAERSAANEPPAFTPPPAPNPSDAPLVPSAPPMVQGSEPATAASSAAAPKASTTPPARPSAGKLVAVPNRALLEAKVRAGRAGPREAQQLLSLCQRDGDARCMGIARAALERGPAR
ncbi:MAG TPA: FHA domain-containing protein [Polyangiaceae bacterium]|nr:FHA domain-containing protein [Polyangiaceae bacterium]